MSAVTVALLVGFVCCALLIRALGGRGTGQRQVRAVVDADRVRVWRATDV